MKLWDIRQRTTTAIRNGQVDSRLYTALDEDNETYVSFLILRSIHYFVYKVYYLIDKFEIFKQIYNTFTYSYFSSTQLSCSSFVLSICFAPHYM